LTPSLKSGQSFKVLFIISILLYIKIIFYQNRLN